MGDFDDNDFDIDELLDEIDSSGTKGKDTVAEAGTGGNTCSASPLDKKKVVGAPGSRSVRFSDTKPTSTEGSEDDYLSKGPPSQRGSLNTLFLASSREEDTPSKPPSAPIISSKPPLPMPTTLSSGRSTRSSTHSSASSLKDKDDWLGIQDGKGSLSPSGSPPPIQRRSATGPPIPINPEPAKTGNSSEEEDALFTGLGLTLPLGGRRSAGKLGGGDQPQTKAEMRPPETPKSRFGLHSNPTTPPMSLGNQESSVLPPKATFSSSYLDQLGASPPPPPTAESSKPAHSLLPKHQPLPSGASLLSSVFPPSAAPAASMFPSEFVPPIPSKIPGGDSFSTFSLAAPPTPSPSQQQIGGTTVKKKVVKKDGGPVANSILTNSSTLQLPSHLINEDELKLMSSSLKTLYANQLEMSEKSYREQLVFLSEANRRREDLLKEEMRGMHTDYEERLDRLKNDVRALENEKSQKEPIPGQYDVTALATLAEQLNSGIVAARDVLQKSREMAEPSLVGGVPDEAFIQRLENILLDNFNRSKEHQGFTDAKLLDMIKYLDDTVGKKFGLMNDAWRNLLGQVKQNMTDLMQASASNANRQSHESVEQEVRKSEKIILGQLETLATAIKGNEDMSPQVISKIEESDKIFLGELAKLHKLQRRTKESTDSITFEPLVKLLESDRDEEQRRRDRLSLHLKEMRRDLKRILMDNEGRQESTQKFSLSTELELKSISQSIRDLNSQLKFSLISGPNHPENLTNQFNSNMNQTQAEMEMKLLRDERQALSESMAQINVEKRKLSEDKVALEKRKLDFEKERDQLRNLELQLKTKLDETEELQRKTESVRREEIHLTSEAQMKTRELEKERSNLREKLMEVEQKFRTWEQNLRQEKVDLMKERDLMDRLRDQLLCPRCLKANEHVAIIHPPPPPYNPLDRSASDYFESRLNNRNAGGLGTTGEDDAYDNYFRKLFE